MAFSAASNSLKPHVASAVLMKTMENAFCTSKEALFCTYINAMETALSNVSLSFFSTSLSERPNFLLQKMMIF